MYRTRLISQLDHCKKVVIPITERTERIREKNDAAAYVAKIKRYNIARIQILHRIWVVRRALGYTHVSERMRGEANTPGAGALVFTQPR